MTEKSPPLSKTSNFITMIALIVALGGLLMGFDASVISGVVRFIEPEFGLSKLELGWAVASLTLSSTLAMLVAGPLSDRIGRRSVLRIAAVLYALSAIGSALAPSFAVLVWVRMLGGLGVGASLILAPMYIAEIAPPAMRGRLVSFNQLNIVIGISLAFFSNYYILSLGESDAQWVRDLAIDRAQWRWMLGVESLPALLYFIGLFFVPRSPRWLIMTGRFEEAQRILARFNDPLKAEAAISQIRASLQSGEKEKSMDFKKLFAPSLRLVLSIGVVMAVLQQITGINAVFFYAPMIFEQSGIGTNAAFIQAILVGLVNLVFTIIAMLLIDRLGRRPLLIFGTLGIFLSMMSLTHSFSQAEFELDAAKLAQTKVPAALQTQWLEADPPYETEKELKQALLEVLGPIDAALYEPDFLQASIRINSQRVLIAILCFVASFAVSIGPVMWVLFSELFPNNIRGVAISFVGLINSAVSFLVQWIFPWELNYLGSAGTFFIYGIFAALGLAFILWRVPETKGKSLEELEQQLVKS